MLVYCAMLIISLIFAGCADLLRSKYLAEGAENGGRLSKPVILESSKTLGTDEARCYIFVALSGLPFFLVAALRYFVGTDYGVYLNNQVLDVMTGRYDTVEILYRYIMELSAYLLDGRSYQLIFVFTHLLIVGFVFAAVRRLSWNYTWSVLILFLTGWYNVSLNIMRQCICIAIFLYAIRFIMEKKPVQYFIAITIAACFHKTAVLFYPIYFVSLIRINNGVLLAFLAACYALKDYILKVIYKLAELLGYEGFYEGEYYFKTLPKVPLLYNIAILVLVMFGIWYFHTDLEDRVDGKLLKRYDNLLINTQAITALVCLLAEIIPNNTRILYAFMSTQIVLLPRVLAGGTGDLKKKTTLSRVLYVLYKAIILALAIMMFVKMILDRDLGETIYYQSIFQTLK